MRWIAWILMLLLAVGWFLATIVPEERAADEAMTTWRRTERGWERRDLWQMANGSQRPPLHPLVVSAFGVLTVGLVLVASSDEH